MNTGEPFQAQSSDDLIHKAKQRIQQGQISEAEGVVLELLNQDQDQDNVEGLYLLAVCQRYLKKTAKALETLEKLKGVSPSYGRAFQEQGHIYRQQQDIMPAMDAYKQAVLLNPALLACWQALADLYLEQGDHLAANEMREQVQYLSSLPMELLSVTSMIHEGKLYKAEQLCRSYLQKIPHHADAMRLLADIGARMQVLDDAEFLLESCVEFHPDNKMARFDYANLLNKRQKFKEALEQIGILHDEAPDNLAFNLTMANAYVGAGDIEAALLTYEEVLRQAPNNPNVLLMQGHALKAVARVEEAVSVYRGAYSVRPDFGDAFWSLANLKTYRFNDEEIEMMKERQSDKKTVLIDRIHFCFALGKAFEDREEYAVAMEYYQLGNSLKVQESRYSADIVDKEFQAQIQVCNGELFDKHDGRGSAASDPIFIVGLPRAGSTLLEQILSSHSQVDGTMELPNVIAIMNKLNGRRKVGDEQRYPAILNDLSADQLAQLGEEYISGTQIYRQGAAYFIDKMPNNFRHIGLIHTILPNAKIIDARRHPMACCFSGFKQLFAEGQEFTYGQKDIGRYYKNYVELMDHWDEVLPGKVLRVHYEDVVNGLESQVHRILEYCGLAFEESCMNFHQTERAVKTPSSEQVRQPIFKSGIEQWKNFEPYLDQLRGSLGSVVDAYDAYVDSGSQPALDS